MSEQSIIKNQRTIEYAIPQRLVPQQAIERLHNINGYLYELTLLDGSHYHVLVTDSQDVKQIVEGTKYLRIKHNIENVRVWPKSHKITATIGEAVGMQNPEATIHFGGTNFFRFSIPELADFLNNNQPYVDTGVNTTPLNEYGQIRLIEELIQNSFGTINLGAFDEGNHFVMTKPFDGDVYPIGVFTLIYLPASHQVQLHSVAGKIPPTWGIEMANKLPIIMSSVARIMTDNFEFPQDGDSKIESEHLVFTATGAAKLYRNIGFPPLDNQLALGIAYPKINAGSQDQ